MYCNREEFVLQRRVLKLYRNTVHCIVTKRGKRGSLYRNTNWERGRGAQASVRHAGGARGTGRGARGARGAHPERKATRPPSLRHGVGQAATPPCARSWECLCALGRAAGPAGCALGTLSLFLTRFDSVLFLSQFWGKFFRKKKIYIFLKNKSNKIRQNFRKIKFSKNEIFIDQKDLFKRKLCLALLMNARLGI